MNVKNSSPPKAKKKNFFHEKFGNRILDPYYWLKNKDTLEVLKYLEEENKYTNKKLKPLDSLKKTLFKEMKSRLPEKYDQEPVSIGDYFYYSTWKKKKQYPIHKRKRKSDKKEEILLDENKIKTKSNYLDIENLYISPDHKILAYTLDDQGREFYNIFFKDLTTGNLLDCTVSGVTSNFIWANDNKTIFYVQQDEKTLRAFQVYRFHIETGKKELVFEEKDLKFFVSLSKTLCESYIMLTTRSSQTTEYYYLSASSPEKNFSLFCEREKEHEYYLDYGEGFFYILSNREGAFNFKLMKVAEHKQEETKGNYPCSLWEEFISHRENIFIEDYEVFKKFIALEVRFEGHQKIEIFNKKEEVLYKVQFSEKIYSIEFGDNEEYESPFLRLEFQSLTQPTIIYDYEVEKNKLHFKSQIPVKNFSSENYVSRAEEAVASDGSKIPISLVYKKDTKIQASTPLLLYAYGSYGISMDPDFRSSVLSLLDRGFVYAIAHIRGGSEKGKKWYEGGKLLSKRNTFSDFICCAEHLIKQSFTSHSQLYIMGGSAGGLLIGAVLNQRPDLFRATIALVPFVDCLTTMLDESIPLSTSEYEEWGDPNDKIYYDYIQTYSPYDNVKKTKYPHIFVQTGYHDPRVQYWEPAKWVAKLRDYKTDNNLLLLKTDMKSGHFGASGRLEALKLYSLYYAFLIGIERDLIS